MLRFRLGTIPVELHLSHLLFAGFLGWVFAQPGSSNMWPDPVLRNPAHPDHAVTSALAVVVWAAVITASILFHELGHALAARLFGHRPTISLVGLRGITRANAEAPMPWHRVVLFSLAGPVFGLLLATACGIGWLVIDRTHGPEAAVYLLKGAFWGNLFWAVLNLLPVQPLAGGRAVAAVLMRLFGRKGFLYSQLIALALGLAMLPLALAAETAWLGIFMGIFFAMYLMRTALLIQAYRRGELPIDDPASPNEVALGRAELLFRDGHYLEARGLCEQLLAQELQASQRARAHYLLGWVALKEGKGREALDHFTRRGAPQGFSVEPQALAAAFSLVGDEERAVPLWHMAATTSKDPTLRHELAGALIRAGRVNDARRLPDVRMATAWTAAERVWTLRGELEKAANASEEAFQSEPSAELAYDAACAWARAGQAAAAMRMLQLASQNGFSQVDVAKNDPDLSSLRDSPDFNAWLGSLKAHPPAT